MPKTAYKQKSNIITSGSVPQSLEGDYWRLKKMLKANRMGMVEYAILSFCENHKGCEKDFTARTMRLST
jgi:hypothetical protein